MADRIEVNFKDTLGKVLDGLPEKIRKASEEVVQKTAEKVFNRIKFATPRDTGKAAAGWARRQEGEESVIFNNVDYINVLEFGGYPVIPASKTPTLPGLRRGNAFLGGGYPPGPRTQVSSGEPEALSNMSRQAPNGMVRKNLAAIRPEFLFDLEEAIDRALNEGP